jgi:bifunctional DNase/RNase
VSESETTVDNDEDPGLESPPAGEADEPGEAGEAGDAEEAEAFQPPAHMHQMVFVDVSLVLPSTHPVVVLQEADMPYRELRIPVGGAEGVAIGYAARQVPTPRPLTHEMISSLLDKFDLNLDAVHITSVTGANFTAALVVSGPSGTRTIDCRPSDAIALALRRRIPVPIMAVPEVIELCGEGAAGAN